MAPIIGDARVVDALGFRGAAAQRLREAFLPHEVARWPQPLVDSRDVCIVTLEDEAGQRWTAIGDLTDADRVLDKLERFLVLRGVALPAKHEPPICTQTMTGRSLVFKPPSGVIVKS